LGRDATWFNCEADFVSQRLAWQKFQICSRRKPIWQKPGSAAARDDKILVDYCFYTTADEDNSKLLEAKKALRADLVLHSRASRVAEDVDDLREDLYDGDNVTHGAQGERERHGLCDA
jgi:hypothetical protein